jgi:hypothetical protein
MQLIRPLVIAALLLATAAPASADFTFIVGSNTTPSKRAFKGFTFGGGGTIATEFEYANNGESLDEATPALRTFMGNMLVQTPFPVAGFQPYATAGLAFNSGVGVKRNIFGPLKVRLDYRVLKLRGEPIHGSVHRVYSGIHLAF